MSSEPFRIEVDPSHQLLRFTLVGVWDLATAQAFDQALRPRFEACRIRSQPFDVIADLSAWPVQTQETTGIHEALMAFGRECGMRNVAIVVASMLVKMQTMRLASNDHFQAFDSETEAREWIMQMKAAS